MYKVGIIGDKDSVLGFKAVGLEVFPCSRSEEAKKILHPSGAGMDSLRKSVERAVGADILFGGEN